MRYPMPVRSMETNLDIAKKRFFLLCLPLFLATLIAYEPLRHNDFVRLDDDYYVTGNPQVLNGLTKEGLAWAFTDMSYTANWHPLTWISHMVDVELFGTVPFWHHLVNLLYHIANTLLLFWIFYRMTGALWPSFFVAALFALHPLHVESVAWVSERKDVLSGFLGILTIIVYRFYAAKPGVLKYLAVVFLFVLGLLSKPMLVTLPFILLLLDLWPLRRFNSSKPGRGFWMLFAEKIPLLLLSAGSSVITFLAQRQAGAMIRGQHHSLIIRLENAAVSYIGYILKLVYPVRLAVLYPHPGDTLPLWKPIASASALLLITLVILLFLAKNPYLFVGWFWYLGSLVPVIGLVQVGTQAMADRYMYLPAIGLFILLAWGLEKLVGRLKYLNTALVMAGFGVLFILVLATRNQVALWKDSLTLFGHTLDVTVTENNFVIHNNYACALHRAGQLDLAADNFREALALKPDYVIAHNNYGMLLRDQGKLKEAVTHWEKALEFEPRHPNAHANLGVSRMTQGDFDRAIEHFQIVLQVNPDFPNIHFLLGMLYFQTGKLDLAEENFKQALARQPGNTAAMNRLAIVFIQQGRMEEALNTWKRILEIEPDFLPTRLNLASALAQNGHYTQAIEHYTYALRIEPRQPEVLSELAASYASSGQFEKAIEAIENALALSNEQENKTFSDSLRRQLEDYNKILNSEKEP